MDLGHPSGIADFLAALRSEDAGARRPAFAALGRLPVAELGRGGVPGRIGLSVEDVVAAVAPWICVFEAPESEPARAFCLTFAFDAARELLAPLREHPDPRIFLPVLGRFAAMDADDGTLAIIERWLVGPGLAASRDRDRPSEIATTLCGALGSWGVVVPQPRHRARAAAVALRVLDDALRGPSAAQVLARPVHGWLYVEYLMRAQRAADLAQRLPVLQRLVAHRELDVVLRCDALADIVEATAVQPPGADDLPAALFDPAHQAADAAVAPGLLARLHALGLVGRDDLLRVLGDPAWLHHAARVLAGGAQGAAPHAGSDPAVAERLLDVIWSLARVEPMPTDAVPRMQAVLGLLRGAVPSPVQRLQAASAVAALRARLRKAGAAGWNFDLLRDASRWLATSD